MTKVIAIANQKGGVGKTTTTVNLAVALVRSDKKVLVIDCDPQASLTEWLGHQKPDDYSISISTIMQRIADGNEIFEKGINQHEEGFDYVASSLDLSATEVRLINAMSREKILGQYVDLVKSKYDYVLIDCMPSLGMLPVNAMACADSIIIPVHGEFLSVKGLNLFLQSISKVKKTINPKLKIEGIVLTMVDKRTNVAKEVEADLRNAYGHAIKIFKTIIPRAISAAENPASGVSIYKYDEKGTVAKAYLDLMEEISKNEKRNEKVYDGFSR